MTISSKEAQKVRILVDKDVVDTSFEKWAKPGHFSRTLAKGPKTTTLTRMILIVKQIHLKMFLVKFLVLILVN